MALQFSEAECKNLEVSSKREYILTNGIGGFSMGTISGINTRRYHGLLVAATDPPVTRMVLLAAMDASVTVDGSPVGISCNQYPGAIFPEGYLNITAVDVSKEVRTDYRVGTATLCRIIQMQPGENTITLTYRNTGTVPLQLKLNPLVCHKFYHGNFYQDASYPDDLQYTDQETVIEHGGVSLHIGHPDAIREPMHGWYYRFEHAREIERGLDPRDDLFCPCELTYQLSPGEAAVLTASDRPGAAAMKAPLKADTKFLDTEAQLRQAADHFIVEGGGRTTIIAGYPWFTDWGRDTMISLPGILLHTGRIREAKDLLKAYAGQMSKGLIPNRFVEHGAKPDYNTVDASLWFVNAIYLTLKHEWDQQFAEKIFPALQDLFEWHVKGTYFGIKADVDGLLTQGEGNVQLTWMDAKIGDWVVTPRHGKPVEVNGLWINALRAMEWLAKALDRPSKEFADLAAKAEASFEEKFWHPGRRHYLDTVDPDDASLRPNQLIAMSLPFGPAKGEHAAAALDTVTSDLLTPYGLRTLGWREPGYQGRYEGPLPNMDACYHQGTVWPWLFGPYLTALVKVKGAASPQAREKVKKEARELVRMALTGPNSMLRDYGIGGVSEVYDGDAPHRPNGCPWQAWSAGELLRAWIEDCRPDPKSPADDKPKPAAKAKSAPKSKS